ncbi:MAG TPA: transposase [bacterium]|nr:transposase [bacterium]
MISIKSISDILAAQFIAGCGDIKCFEHYKQIEKFSGFNLRIQQSGNYASSNHIHKMGNKRLSRVIYQATEKAVQYIPEIRIKYISRKKIKNIYKKNIVACVPNLISLIFSLVKANKKYELDHDKFKELCDLENKLGFAVKDIKHYTPAEKGVYCRLKQVKIKQIEN